MRMIYKYTLESKGIQTIEVKGLIHVLSVAEQRNKMVLYCVVDRDADMKGFVDVKIAGTGHPIDFKLSEWGFLGTVKLLNGDVMFHIFIRIHLGVKP